MGYHERIASGRSLAEPLAQLETAIAKLRVDQGRRVKALLVALAEAQVRHPSGHLVAHLAEGAYSAYDETSTHQLVPCGADGQWYSRQLSVLASVQSVAGQPAVGSFFDVASELVGVLTAVRWQFGNVRVGRVNRILTIKQRFALG